MSISQRCIVMRRSRSRWKILQLTNGWYSHMYRIYEQKIFAPTSTSEKYFWEEILEVQSEVLVRSTSTSNQKHLTAQNTWWSTSNPKYFNIRLEVLQKYFDFQLNALWSEVWSNLRERYSGNSDISSLKTIQIQREITNWTTEILTTFSSEWFPMCSPCNGERKCLGTGKKVASVDLCPPPNLFSSVLRGRNVRVDLSEWSPWRGGEVNEWKPRMHSAPLTQE
jgi:hypothetical protein